MRRQVEAGSGSAVSGGGMGQVLEDGKVRTLTAVLGWPLGFSRAATPSSHGLGWPVSREKPRAADADVSRETAIEAVSVSRETASEGPSVSRETPTDVREELAATIPDAGDDTPLAQTLAQDARRRIALTGRRFPAPPATRVLTVANQKGGVGKTTTTVNVAAALAQSGLKVLVIDLDPQGNASTALGVDHHAEVPSVYDVLVDGKAFADVVVPCTTVEGLFCAPATIDLAGAEIELVSLVAREMRLARALTAHLETTDLDYVLIDCPPSLGLLTVNAFVAASEVFIPIQCEYYALEGLSQLLKNIELIRGHLNPGLHVSTILLTMYDGRTRLSSQVADEVRAHFPDQVLRTTVPRSVRVSEAPSFGETVMTYDPTSSGALSYLEASGELADRGAAQQIRTEETNDDRKVQAR
jgi:chromosome partitioning protein